MPGAEPDFFFPQFEEPPQQQQKKSKKQKATPKLPVRAPTIKKTEGYLYKALLDYDGNHFRTSKFTADGKEPLRDFTYNAVTGILILTLSPCLRGSFSL